MLILSVSLSSKGSFTLSPAIITLPSAGETIASGSGGAVLSGSLKKKQTNSVSTANNRAGRVNPKTTSTTVVNAGAKIKG